MNREILWQIIDFVWLMRSCSKEAMMQDVNKYLARLGFKSYCKGVSE